MGRKNSANDIAIPADSAAIEARLTPEVRARLEAFAAELRRWQAKINLVGAATLPDLWRRHILDSIQLLDLAPAPPGRWIDLGSGGGFPGLVLSIVGHAGVTLVEADARKCAFLRQAARASKTEPEILQGRIEALAAAGRLAGAQVISARALAPLDSLLGLVEGFITPDTVCLFPKGQDVDAELTEAARSWKMQVETIPSCCDPKGVILRVRDVHRL